MGEVTASFSKRKNCFEDVCDGPRKGGRNLPVLRQHFYKLWPAENYPPEFWKDKEMREREREREKKKEKLKYYIALQRLIYMCV